jgi:hypothetical protein
VTEDTPLARKATEPPICCHNVIEEVHERKKQNMRTTNRIGLDTTTATQQTIRFEVDDLLEKNTKCSLVSALSVTAIIMSS